MTEKNVTKAKKARRRRQQQWQWWVWRTATIASAENSGAYLVAQAELKQNSRKEWTEKNAHKPERDIQSRK